jgi:hypothetical protein
MEWDLFDFKQKILEEIQNSTFDAKEKKDMIAKWTEEWNSFISDFVNGNIDV